MNSAIEQYLNKHPYPGKVIKGRDEDWKVVNESVKKLGAFRWNPDEKTWDAVQMEKLLPLIESGRWFPHPIAKELHLNFVYAVREKLKVKQEAAKKAARDAERQKKPKPAPKPKVYEPSRLQGGLNFGFASKTTPVASSKFPAKRKLGADSTPTVQSSLKLLTVGSVGSKQRASVAEEKTAEDKTAEEKAAAGKNSEKEQNAQEEARANRDLGREENKPEHLERLHDLGVNRDAIESSWNWDVLGPRSGTSPAFRLCRIITLTREHRKGAGWDAERINRFHDECEAKAKRDERARQIEEVEREKRAREIEEVERDKRAREIEESARAHDEDEDIVDTIEDVLTPAEAAEQRRVFDELCRRNDKLCQNHWIAYRNPARRCPVCQQVVDEQFPECLCDGEAWRLCEPCCTMRHDVIERGGCSCPRPSPKR